MRYEVVEIDPIDGVEADRLSRAIRMTQVDGRVHCSFIDRVYGNGDAHVAIIVASERVDDAERLFDMAMDPL